MTATDPEPGSPPARRVVAGTEDAALAGGDSGDGAGGADRDSSLSIFRSRQFLRLWVAQVVSATGDWLGFIAITITAARVGGGTPEAAVGFVVAARIVPGFFLAPLAGVLVDRWDRKKVMVVCDLSRAAVLAGLAFVDTVWQLVVASLVLEVFTLLWSPAKEASVPNIVSRDQLTAANSLSLVAAYGTFPVASAMAIGLAKLATQLEKVSALDALRIDQESLAFYVDSITFLASAALIATLGLASRPKEERRRTSSGRRIDFGQTFRELKEGWEFIFIDPVVRAVNVGLATGLIGGGMLVPLGPVFSIEVLGAGLAGFSSFITALGFGVAVGIVLLSVFQGRIRKVSWFVGAVFGAGFSLLLAAAMSSLAATVVLVGALGICAGGVYVLGFTLLHETVEDELRGRIFSALYTLVRLCILIAFAIGPFLAALLDGLSDRYFDGDIDVLGLDVAIPGVRLTLWLAALIILLAGVLALYSLRLGERASEEAGP